jgi:hypothetical protein
MVSPTVSIVIRTKNEETYIRACLKAISSQTYPVEEIILVDNQSTDATVSIASEFPKVKVLTVEEYSPGKSLNIGAKESIGQVLVFLSAHCVPCDDTWLNELILGFDGHSNINVVGVYGRQLPLPYSHPQDKRDLLSVFGEEDKLQAKESFFHNANSAVLRGTWEIAPFDEVTPHIEDRIWAKSLISQGKNIYYASRARVFHWNGLHSSGDPDRSLNSIKILQQIGVAEEATPEFLQPARFAVLPIIPAKTLGKHKEGFLSQLRATVSECKGASYLLNPLIVTDHEVLEHELDVENCLYHHVNDAQLSIESALQAGLSFYEQKFGIPDYVCYLNPEYVGRDGNLIDELLLAILENGSDSAFFGYEDYGHYWHMSKNSGWKQSEESMAARETRPPSYKALYGFATITRASIIRDGSLLGEKISIRPIESYEFRGLSSSLQEQLRASRQKRT